jgi:hypothetical protein
MWSCTGAGQFVGGDANRGTIGIDMAVQVDQTGSHQLAAGIEHAQSALGRDVGFQRFDHAVTDADVALAAQRLAGIKYVAALDDQIELVPMAAPAVTASAAVDARNFRRVMSRMVASLNRALPPIGRDYRHAAYGA